MLRWTSHSMIARPVLDRTPSRASAPDRGGREADDGLGLSGVGHLALAAPTPAVAVSTMNTATASGSIRAVTSTASAIDPRGHAGLGRRKDPAVAVPLGHHRRRRGDAAQLDERGGQDGVTGHHPGQPPLALLLGAEPGDGGRRGGQGLDHRARRRRCVPAASASSPVSTNPRPAPPTVLGQGDAQQAGGRQFGPELAVEAVAVGLGLDLAQPLLGRQVGEDPVGQLADGLLLLAEGEVHDCLSSSVAGSDRCCLGAVVVRGLGSGAVGAGP